MKEKGKNRKGEDNRIWKEIGQREGKKTRNKIGRKERRMIDRSKEDKEEKKTK